MFICEQANDSVTELESRDVTFLKNNFLRRSEINQDLSLYEMENLDDQSIQNQRILVPEEEIRSTDPSGSNKKDDEFVLLYPPLRRTSHKSIPHHHFDIEGEDFIVASWKEDERRSVLEALSCPTKDQ